MKTYVFSYLLDGSSDFLTYYCRAPSLKGALKSLCFLFDNYCDRLAGFQFYYIVRSSDKSYTRRLPDKYCALLSQHISEVDYEN